MKKIVLVLFGLILPLQALAAVAPADYCAGFKDVSVKDANCMAIQYVKNQGIFQGYSDGTFRPNAVINRAEAAKVILNGFKLHILPDDATNLDFTDVQIGAWYMPYLRTAKANSIIQGYEDRTFRPAQQVIRAEMLKLFLQTAALVGAKGPDGVVVTKDQFSAPVSPVSRDVSGGEWFASYFNYAKNEGLIDGKGTPIINLYLYPQNGMTRGDLASLFYKF